MTLIMSTQGKDTDQLLTFSKQDQQLLCEYEIDEIEANIKLTFTSPQYTINNNRYSILNDQNDWIDVLLPFQRKIDDETQLLSIIQNLSDNNYRYEVDNDYFINNNKLKFKATNFKALKSDDHYFCKAFGLIKGTIYERDEQGFITATNILYPYIYKYICINCYDIQDYTLIDQGQKRYLLLKQFRTWNAGTITQVTSDIIVTFQVNQLIKGFRIQFQDEMYQDLQLNGDEYTLELYINKSKKVLMRMQQQEEARILKEQEFEYKKQLEQQRQASVQQQYIEQEQQAQQQAQNIQFQQESDLQKQEDLWRTTSIQIPNDNEYKKNINYNYDILQQKKGQKAKLGKMYKKKQLKAQQFLLEVQMLDEEIEELEESRLKMLLSVNKNDVKMSVQDLRDIPEGQFPKVVKRDPNEQINLSDRPSIQQPITLNELNNSVHPPIVKVDPNEVVNQQLQSQHQQQEPQLQQQTEHPPVVKVDPNETIQPQDQSWTFDTNKVDIPIIKNENQTKQIEEYLYQQQQNEEQQKELEYHYQQMWIGYLERLEYLLRQVQTKEQYDAVEQLMLENTDYMQQNLNDQQRHKLAQEIFDAVVRYESNKEYQEQNPNHEKIEELQQIEEPQQIEEQQEPEIVQYIKQEYPDIHLDQAQVQQMYDQPFDQQLPLMTIQQLKNAYIKQEQSQQVRDFIIEKMTDEMKLVKNQQQAQDMKQKYEDLKEIIKGDKSEEHKKQDKKIYDRLRYLQQQKYK
ncbi:obscurin-like_isoform X3 [Hexamita inflata]|uniref:Obscurin-like isoform X3 n=1 Tax=Hexamita inflata TaxID=28002 RepID=A0AA86QYG8_9EUKA|nr:obscurin-like isoform X3 [Hexamita inflata]